MTIAVDTGIGLENADALNWASIIGELTIQQPHHYFLFLSPNLTKAAPAGNIVTPDLPAEIKFLQKLRRRVWLKKQLHQYQPEVLLTTEWLPAQQGQTAMLFLLKEETWLYSSLPYAKKANGLLQTLKKADHIIVPSEAANVVLTKKLAALQTKTTVCYPSVAPFFTPLNSNQKQLVKDKYTGGKEYFLYAGTISPGKGIIDLLKAFSLFKKRQWSNIKLVLAGNVEWPNNGFIQKLATYKFRDDVIVLPVTEPKQLAELVASAYACADAGIQGGYSVFQLQAQQTATPFISCHQQSEPASPSVMFCERTEEAIAEKMKWLYKDETMRSAVIELAAPNRQAGNISALAALLWHTIDEAIYKR